MARGGQVRVKFGADTTDLSRGTARAERDLKKLDNVGSRSFGRLKQAAAGAGVAIAGGLIVELKRSAEAAIEAEKSQARLQAQLKASGLSFKQHAGVIDTVIQKHSQLSGLDDEDLTDAFTNIVRVTGDVDKSLRLTGLAADFARAKHMDVAKAGEIVGKVAGGNIGILSRYGIQIDKGATSTQALGQLQEKFAGQAKKYGETTGGSVDRANVAFENLEETIGKAVAPTIANVADKLAKFVTEMDKGTGAGGRFVDKLRAIKDAVAPVVKFFVDHPKLIAIAVGAWVAYRIAATAALAATRVKLIGQFLGLAGSATAGGAAAGTAFGTAAAGSGGLGSKATQGRFARAGRLAGGAFGLAFMYAYKDEIRDLLRDIENDTGINLGTRKVPLSDRDRRALEEQRRRRPQINPWPGTPVRPGTPVPRAQTGGMIPGSGRGDTVPAMLEPGEFVMRRKVVEQLGPTFFADINAQRFAEGGQAQSASWPSILSRVWGAVGGTFGGRPMPQTTRIKGSRRSPALGSSGGVTLPRWAHSDISAMRASGLGTLLHEWAHAFQRPWVWRDLQLAEGGAEAYANVVTPRVARPLGFRGSYRPYAPYVKDMRQALSLGSDWVLDGQFNWGTSRGVRPQRLQTGGLVGERLQNARTIIQVGKSMSATQKQLLAAIMAALVESNLRNLPYGDRDSVGVFQQRPSQGWTGLMNVARAAAEFFRHAKGVRSAGSAGMLAQAVQRSAFPGRYDQRRAEATAILAALSGGVTSGGAARAPVQLQATKLGGVGHVPTEPRGNLVGFSTRGIGRGLIKTPPRMTVGRPATGPTVVSQQTTGEVLATGESQMVGGRGRKMFGTVYENNFDYAMAQIAGELERIDLHEGAGKITPAQANAMRRFAYVQALTQYGHLLTPNEKLKFEGLIYQIDRQAAQDVAPDLQAQLDQANLKAFNANRAYQLSEAGFGTIRQSGDIGYGINGASVVNVFPSLVPYGPRDMALIGNTVTRAVDSQGARTSTAHVSGV